MSITVHGSSSEGETSNIVDVDGFAYFVVERDLTKGDRRCDGKFMSNFFMVDDTQGEAISDVRRSRRVVKKRELSHTLCLDTFKDQELTNVDVGGLINVGPLITTSKKRHSAKDIMNNDNSIEDPACTAIVPEEDVSCNTTVAYQTNEVVDDFDMSSFMRGVRRPEDGIRCAGRKGTTRLLWLHEFFVVNEGTTRQPKKSVYQALQFLLGAHCPQRYVEDMTDDTRRDIWVLGIRHVPAHEVRHCSTRHEGYLFHTLHNDGDARTALLGKCPELVRVQNGLIWHNIHSISIEVPRVVHPDDVQIRRVHVAGRKRHYVCGVTALEDPLTNTYSLSLLPRSEFSMYPEEVLGMELNSASIMWEHIEDIFQKIRVCMSSGRQGTSSATFTMPLLSTVFDFWGVSMLLILHYYYRVLIMPFCILGVIRDS
jgi:hypothetical protein